MSNDDPVYSEEQNRERFWRNFGNITPPRFRSREDAELFMECLRTGERFPIERWVWPYEVVGGCSVMSREYKDAPFELGYLECFG